MSDSSKRENIWVNLGLNVFLPALFLSKGGDLLPFLSPPMVLIIALAFPVGYFFYDLKTRAKRNVFSIIGFVSILITGGIGLFKFPPEVFAIKEAMIPLLFGLIIIATSYTSKPLIKVILYNPDVIEVSKVDKALDTQEKRNAFNAVLKKCTWLMAVSLLVSSALNYIITTLVVTTDPKLDQEAYNSEIGMQTVITMVVIFVATAPLSIYALMLLFKKIKALTGYDIEDILIGAKVEKPSEAS